MLRALLTYPLIVALAVGPLLCCCTAGRVLGSSQAPKNLPQPVPAQKPAKVGHSCCAHKNQPSEKPASPKPAPSKPGQCPCKDGASKVQATSSVSNPVDQAEQVRPIAPDFFTPIVSSGIGVCTADRLTWARYGPSSLFPSASDLLFWHHKLRC
jgi:hypothetical protein